MPTPHTSKLRLSTWTGQEVFASDGTMLGHVADLIVGLRGPGSPTVTRLLVRHRRTPDVVIPWTRVADFGRHAVHLRNRPDVDVTAAVDVCDDEFRLVRDVLDTQVVDVAWRRLARVADVLLAETADKRLGLVGVEVGFGGVLRRLGLRRLATHTRQDVVSWSDLHLTSARGHAVQLNAPRSALHHLDEGGLAALVDRLDVESAAEVLAAAEPRLAARVVCSQDSAFGERMLRAMPGDEAVDVLAAMSTKHSARWRIRLTGDAPPVRRLLRSQIWPRRRRTPHGRSR